MPLKTDKMGMVANRYTAQNEFELYGAIIKDLRKVYFDGTANRVFCFSKTNTEWNVSKTFETPVDDECGDFFQMHKDSYFMVVVSPMGNEVTFYGKQLSILCKQQQARLCVVDFEDRSPNDAFLNYEKQQLKESAAFLRKLLKDG